MTIPQFNNNQYYTLQDLLNKELKLDIEIKDAALFKKNHERYLFETSEDKYLFKLQYTIPEIKK